MYQVAAAIWNRIAATVSLPHPWATLFSLPQEQLAAALEEQIDKLTSSGTSPRVARAYQTVAPLLGANAGISRYFEITGDSLVRRALPEVTTPAEAVVLATAEFSLNSSEREELINLITTPSRRERAQEILNRLPPEERPAVVKVARKLLAAKLRNRRK